MHLVAALVYWVIVVLWLAVLSTVCVSYLRNRSTFGATRLLLSVLAIDTSRNIIENLYFGLYFGAQYGLFPGAIVGVLGKPGLLIIPKLINVAAACVVLSLLLLRWLPMAMRERAKADNDVREKSTALTQEIEEHRRLFETSADLIVVTDRDRIVTRISHSCLVILGYRPDEVIGAYGGNFIRAPDLETLRQEMQLSIQGEAIRNFQTGFIHKDGRVVTLALTGVWSEQAQRFFLIGRDMTEREAAEEKLRQLAHFDQLTKLPNRTSLLRDLREMLIERTDRPRLVVSIAMFDLDGFKDINDTLGHATGDRLLEEVARRLSETAGASGQVYRLGGDEFFLILPGCRDPLVIARVVESFLRRVEERFEINGRGLFVAASAGIAIATAEVYDADELIANADLALYDAKAVGGRKYSLYMPSMRAKARARQEIDSELRRACSDNEFVLHFQPQLRMSDGAVVGAEALLRWKHPQRGLLAPAAFIDALVQSPAALEAGRWILQAACEAAASWRAKGLPPIRMGVNLFPAQFHDGMLLDDVKAVLGRTGLPADALELEITENIALGHDDGVLAALRMLRAIGVGLAFDDFGTGYASLSYLMRYPLTRIKIDRSFVQKIGEESALEDTAIVRSIITMGHNLNFEVTAEGVETLAQAAFLQAKKCDEVQGFLYSKPIPAKEFEDFLRGSSNVSASRNDLQSNAV
jgi:diguanylate cyclase (GGDEF)-like protein/PAS domain S-box-containing protein